MSRPERPREAGGAGAGSRKRFELAIGTSRRSKLLSLGTAVAIVIAVAAFIVLPSDEEGAGLADDPYTKALDELCVERKRDVAAAQEEAVAGASLSAVSRYADSLVPIVGEWRLDLARSAPPSDRRDRVDGLRAALLEVEIEAGTLARRARESNRRGVAVSAARVDAATENVEAAIASLGLSRCAEL